MSLRLPHYVYTLVDPRTATVFYVGKGQRYRAWQHEQRVRQGKLDANYPKAHMIRGIIAAGHEVRVEIVARYAVAAEAFEHEKRLIAEIGLDSLTNIQPGGVPEYRPDPNRQHRGRRKAINVLRKYLRVFDGWPHGGTFPGLKNGDQLAQEWVSIVRAMIADYDAADRAPANI